MQLAPAAVVEVSEEAALHPDVLAEGGQCPQRIAIGRAGGDRVGLGDPQLADRLDHEIAALNAGVRGDDEVRIQSVEGEAQV